MSKTGGSVKWFDNAKGYGFTMNPEGVDVCIHYRSIISVGFKTLSEGQEIALQQVKSDNGWLAAEIKAPATA